MRGPAQHATYAVRGLELAYHTWGAPEGRPVLAIHGFMDHGQSYAFMAEHLSDALRLIAPDMRGHGHSGWVGAGGYYHFYDYFDDLRVLVDHLGLERFSLVAHSMGGSVAAGLVALMPERVDALILLEGMGPPFVDPADQPMRLRSWTDALRRKSCEGDVPQRRAARRALDSLDEAAARLVAMNHRLTPERAAALARTFTEPSEDEAGVVWRQDPLHRTPSAKPFLRAEAEALWRRFRCPVLSLVGAESPWRPDDLEARHAVVAEALAAAGVPRGLVAAAVPGAGHNIHHDAPELLARAVEAWIHGAALPAELLG